jgi:hypothetical protein
MNFLWIVAGASLVVACLAWRRARQATDRLDQLSQMCWELKYQQGEMRQQLLPRPDGTVDVMPIVAPGRPREAFVPLTSLKR